LICDLFRFAETIARFVLNAYTDFDVVRYSRATYGLEIGPKG
jgi:hypothetical protein